MVSKIPISVIQGRIKGYIEQADRFLLEGAHSHALAYLFRGLGLAEVLDNKWYLSKITLKIIEIYHNTGQADLVVEWAEVANNCPVKPEIEGQVLDYQVFNLIRRGEFERAQTILLEMLLNQNLLIQRIVHMNLGLLYIYLFKYLKLTTLAKSESCLRKALQLAEGEGNQQTCGQIYFYLALLKIEEGLFYNAREELLQAQALVKKPALRVHILNELGKVSMKLLDYESAEEYLIQGRDLAEKLNDATACCYNKFYTGLLYFDQFQLERGHSSLMTALYDFIKNELYLEAANISYLLAQFFQNRRPEKEKHYRKEFQKYSQRVPYYGGFHFQEIGEALGVVG